VRRVRVRMRMRVRAGPPCAPCVYLRCTCTWRGDTRKRCRYVAVVFGGYTGYKSDDLSKIPWMVRIGKTARGGAGLDASSYYTSSNELRIDHLGAPSLLNSFLYVNSLKFEQLFKQLRPHSGTSTPAHPQTYLPAHIYLCMRAHARAHACGGCAMS
jgi:hypothetical protein